MTPTGPTGPVLVVEDDDDVREAMADTLESVGYQVLAAMNGEDALTVLRAERCLPCVILLDLTMPVMDGWQFREEQLKDPELSEIPVVAVTGHSDMQGFGGAAQLVKPVRFDSLVGTVERLCGRPPGR